MIYLYCVTDGPNWDFSLMGWPDDSADPSIEPDEDLANWEAVTLEDDDTVSELQLNGTGLSGTIPKELGRLTGLTFLNLELNRLSGSIPKELSNLTLLEDVQLQDNQLSGPIPKELGNLTNLSTLSLQDNQLSGPIPKEFRKLTNLSTLFLYNNRLSGPIPKELSEMTKLTGLYFNNNQLSGPIPPQLGSLPKLQAVELDGNNLTGTIPTELGNLTGANLTGLRLNNNRLTGTIPTELNTLTKLTTLNLYQNQLTGTIPTELNTLTALTGLRLNNNRLTGTIPTELNTLTKLTRLYLNDNELTGAIPTQLVSALTALRGLGLSGNKLTGAIPTQLGNLPALTELYLNDNELTGAIPTQLGNLPALTELYLSDNELTGAIPWTPIGSLTKLTRLYLNDNELTGAIPTELGSLTDLEELGFWGNSQLTWTGISTELHKKVDRAALRSLRDVNKAGDATWFPSSETSTNRFSFSSWDGVEVNAGGRVSELNLRSNGMTGEITNALEVMGGLESVNLSYNRSLAGTLPVRLRNVASLTSLDISCTRVSVPADMDFQDWVGGDEFEFRRQPCPPPPALPPPPPPVITSAEGVVHGEETEDGFPLNPREENGYITYREGRIDISVTRDEGVPSGFNPAVIIPRDILDRVQSITFHLSGVDPDPPSGFRLAGFTADINIDLGGVELSEGEAVTVCLPSSGDEGESLYHYDEVSEEWKRLESNPQEVNRDKMVCAETNAFSLFAVFAEEEEVVPSPSADGSGCALAARNGKAGAFNLLLIILSVLLLIPGRNLLRL